MALSPGAKVLVVGNGPVQCLAARLAAIKGYETTLACVATSAATDEKVLFDEAYPKESLPLSLLIITGESVDEAAVGKAINEAEGLIVAFDSERTLPEPSMKVFMPEEGGSLSHVSLMSRSLNGQGMGFTATAAKTAANPEIWAGGDAAMAAYRLMEQQVTARATAVGAASTVIRAGTLKGGGSGDASREDGGGERSFLNPAFYSMGQQDLVNWRLLYDCEALGVSLSAGDTGEGPGFFAALTSTDRIGPADSHRGGVAAALVEALGCDVATGKDFTVRTTESREFPKPDAWPALFAAAV